MDGAEVLVTEGVADREIDEAQIAANVTDTAKASEGAVAAIEDRAKGMRTGIAEEAPEIEKLSAVINENVIDTLEGTTRPPDPQLEAGVIP